MFTIKNTGDIRREIPSGPGVNLVEGGAMSPRNVPWADDLDAIFMEEGVVTVASAQGQRYKECCTHLNDIDAVRETGVEEAMFKMQEQLGSVPIYEATMNSEAAAMAVAEERAQCANCTLA